MCHPHKTILLCTCEEQQIDPQASWELFRADALEYRHVVGSFMHPSEMPVTRQLVEEKIRSDLNTSLCFDFPYEANEGDTLYVNFENDRFTFSYQVEARSGRRKSGQWVVDFGLGMEATKPPAHQGSVRLARRAVGGGDYAS